MKLLLTIFVISQLTLMGCKKSNDHKSTQMQTSPVIADSADDGGYSGGGGNINAYSSEEFKVVFKEAVETVQRMHLSVPFYLMFLKFDKKLPKKFDVILDKALSVGEGNVGVIKKIDLKFDSYCSSKFGVEKHASVNYTLDSTVCISSKDLELMSKTELKRKLLALIAHEYVHMLGIEDERLANDYQNLIYNNFQMIDNNYFGAAYTVHLRLAYESIYYFFYKDCVVNNLCSDILDFSIERLIDLKKNNNKRDKLLSIIGLIETQLEAVSASYRGLHFTVESSLIDSNIWVLKDNFLYSDFPKSKELVQLKTYLLNHEDIEESQLQLLSVNFIRKVFKLNFVDRMGEIGLVSRSLFFNYCFRSLPLHSKLTSDLLEDYFEVSNFSYKNIDNYLEKFDLKTVRHQGEVIYLPNNRMCSARNIKIPALEGSPSGPILDSDTPIEVWAEDYRVYIKK